jgi:putative Holliday junction resolvase
MRILSVDHGSARAGYAVCDPSATIVTPLGIVEPPDPAQVARIATEQGAELIVVGLPVSLSGDEGEQAEAAREFAAALGTLVTVPVETYDERLTTRLAEETTRGGATAPPDAIAAAHLLESYLRALAAQGREDDLP